MYQLKKNVPAFEVVDGPFEGRQYKQGQNYAEVPPNEAHKFDPIDTGDPPVTGSDESTKGGDD